MKISRQSRRPQIRSALCGWWLCRATAAGICFLGMMIAALCACSARGERSDSSAEVAAAIDVCDTFEHDYVRCAGALGPAAQAAIQADVRTLRASVASMIAEGDTGRAKAKQLCSQRAAQMRAACP